MVQRDPAIYTSPALDLRQLRRSSTPLRVAFLHEPRRGGRPGLLASFVGERRALALDLLLYAHTVAPLSEGRPIRATSTQWMAVVGIEPSASNRATVSRSWSWLEEKRLISSHRQGRDRGIEILREDGTGQLWQPPGAHHEAYFGLPLAYWRGGYASELSLPAKSVLLIGLSLQSREEPFFQLPLRRGSDWYGLSASTLRRGLAELRRVGLLRRWAERRETEGSPLGHTYDQRYALNPLSDRGPLQLASQPADGSEDISF